MDKILIVDENQNLLNSFSKGLDKMHQFDVMTASDIEDAIGLLSENKVSVLVTVMDSPKIDGLELVAYMTTHRPSTPIVITTDYGKPWFRSHAAQSNFLYHIEKPFKIKTLASAIFVGLTLRDEGSNFNGVAMASLLPIIEAQGKSCKMEVASKGRGKGYLYFDDGKLINAHYQKITGEEAALEMAKWDRLTIKFTDLPRRRIRKRVKTDLMEIVGATWQKQELIERDMRALSDGTQENKDSGFMRVIVAQVMKQYVLELRAIKGYMAVGILNEKGAVLDQDIADESIDFTQQAGSLKSLFAALSDSIVKNEPDKRITMTLHTSKQIELVIRVEIKSALNLYLVCLSRPDGNWFFMQHKLAQLSEVIYETLT